ncbi:MAG: hypothetical protein ABFD82_10955 [Syntrophaceae bacterium]
MKQKRRIILFLVLFLSFLMFVIDPETGAAQSRPNQLRSYLKQGIDKIFNMDNQSANIALQKAVELDREDPMGYAFLALAHLVFYEMSFNQRDREKNQEYMLRYVNDTLTMGEKRIEKNSKDSPAYFAMALAKISKLRWAITQKEYFTVTREASSIWDYLERANDADPQNYDIYFIRGMLHYHLDHLSSVIRFFSSLLITSGDRRKGLQELELVAKRGNLLKDLAQAELSQIYMNFEKQPTRALPIIRGLRDKYPRNYNLSFALANTLSDLNQFKEAFAVAREIEKGIQSGVAPFVPQLQPRYEQLIGRILFSQGEYAKAAEYFQMALKDTSFYNARVRVWAFVRLGMIHDIRKEREQAEDYYFKALHVEGGEGTAQVEARQYLKTPYVPPRKP